MNFDLRRTVSRTVLGVTSLALTLALCLPLAGASAQTKPAYHPGFGPGPVVLAAPLHVWPQSYSDVAPDPNIRFGTLPNGMRYAIMKNATPPGQASLRLVIEAGSLMEHDDQQGLAHFLEHMAFRGSTNVPDGDMIKILERHGLAFGADTNASTRETETVYQLDLPHTDDDTVDTSLGLFRETASNLFIASDAVDHERGVILSEERTRDNPEYRLYKSEFGFVMQDHIATRRFPIGLVDVIRNAPNTLIQQFYHDYYRPDHAVLVAVGDFDPDAMEAKIKSKFGDWAPTGAGAPEPKLTLPVRRGPEAKVTVEPGSQLDVSINWVLPPDLTPDSKDERTFELTEGLGFAVLNRRLERIARAPQPPFLGAAIYAGDIFHSTKRLDLDVTGNPGLWREALNAAIVEQRKLVNFGVTQAELDREIAAARTAVAQEAAQAATRRTPGLADEIAGSVDAAEVVTSPEQDLDLFNAEVATVTVAKVNALMKADFAGAGPLAFIGSPAPIEGGDGAVTQALTAALAAPITADQAQVVKAWPYAVFGAPGKVADTQDILDLGTTFVRFDNGVRLTVKPTKFRKDQIEVSVRVGAGRLNEPNTHASADWAFPTSFIEGGLKDLTAEDIDQVMNSKIVSINAGLDDDAITLGGQTRPDDLDSQMQLLTAYVTAPGWRPEPFQRIKASAATTRDQEDSTAEGVLNRELPALLRSGDKRWVFPTNPEIAATTLADVRAIVDKDLASGPIEIVIVGDTTVAKATAAVAATFGSLPARPGPGWPRPPANPVLSFPAPNSQPVILTHKGRADDSYGVVGWKTDGFFADTRKARTLRILGEVMTIRLTQTLRQDLGTTYSPEATTQASSVYPTFGFAAALVETPPDKLPIFFSKVDEIAADLRDKPITDDDLARAKQPSIDALQRQFDSSNEFWLSQLTNAQADSRHLAAIRTALSDLKTISAADIQAAAREYLTPDKAWKLVVKAQGAP